MSFSTQSLTKAKEYIERIKNTATRAKQHAEKAMGVGIAAAEVAGVSAGCGYMNERYGTPDKDGDNVYTVASVDADLAIGVAGHALGFFGALGKYDEHGHNAANGGIGAYAYRQGAKYGRQAKKDAGTTTKGLGANANVGWGAPSHAYARR